MSYFFSGPIAQAFGWRVAMVIAAAPAVLLVPLLLRLREPQRGAAENQPGETLGGGSIRAILRIPTLWWIIASGATLNFNMYALGQFMPAFLSRIHHVTLAASGIGAGITYAIGGIAGSLFAGWLGDRAMRHRPNARLLWASVFSVAGAPFAYFGILAGDARASVAFLTVFYGSLCAYYGFVYASIQDIVTPRMRASAMAIYFMAMYLCGASFGPILTGKVSDVMAQHAAAAAGSATVTEAFRAVGLQQAMLIMPALSVVLAAVLFMGSRTITADIAKRSLTTGERATTSASHALIRYRRRRPERLQG
jgi:sugar phosphate permease